MTANNTFGDRMKALRVERNLLQAEFGEIIGKKLGIKRISPSAIGSYERNEREPSFDCLLAIADFFGVSLDYLMCRSEERLTVDDYLRADNIEFRKALSDLSLTFDGRELSEAEKNRIYDVAFSLLWRE